MAAVRAAASSLAQRHGEEPVLGALNEIDPDYREGLVQLLSGAR